MKNQYKLTLINITFTFNVHEYISFYPIRYKMVDFVLKNNPPEFDLNFINRLQARLLGLNLRRRTLIFS